MLREMSKPYDLSVNSASPFGKGDRGIAGVGVMQIPLDPSGACAVKQRSTQRNFPGLSELDRHPLA